MSTNKKVNISFEVNVLDNLDYGEVDNKKDFLDIMADIWDEYQNRSDKSYEHCIKLEPDYLDD